MTIEEGRILQQLVDRDVIYLASSLVEHFASNPNACCNGVDYDEVLSLCVNGRDEALEHWIVSDWFAEKLADHGEITGELLGLTIWGRTCSGQTIAADGVVREIAEEMEILPGQKYAWSAA